MKKQFCKLKEIVTRFLKHQKGAVAIEMAFIIPLFISLMMAIFDYAILFSLRIGIDKVFQEVIRTVATPEADFSNHYTSTTVPITNNPNLDATKALHRGLSQVVFDISQVQLWGYSETWGGFDITKPLVQRCTAAFTPTPPSDVCNFVTGSSNAVNRLELRYTHTFFTPFGRLVAGGSSVNNTINIVSERYFYLE